MCRQKLIVLKFGGSVLRSKADLFVATQEIYRWYRNGYKVIAVVSAFYGRTDELFDKARSFSDASPFNIAHLVGGAERESASMLGLTLDQCGIPNSVLMESESHLETCGDPLDAEAQSIDVEFINRVLDETNVVVIPGFIGRDRLGRVNLLGRGGSDLTALFVAHSMRADRCRLVKDVEGLYEFDPNKSELMPRRFASLSWDGALELNGSILQHKAIRFAKENQLNFEVASSLASRQTVVGDVDLCFDEGVNSAKVRVGLLGLGAVGAGVFDQLARLRNRFEVTKIAVRNPEKHVQHPRFSGVESHSLLTTDLFSVIEGNCDVLVELIGGTEEAKIATETAIALGKSVVTANKSLMTIQGHEFSARLNLRQQLLSSGAVGGGVPMLEFVRIITQSNSIKRIRGILNGTTNYVLDQVGRGASIEAAVELAQRLGYAERDPSRDLDGVDAAEKLVLLASAAGFRLAFDDIKIKPWDSAAIEGLLGRSTGYSGILRQVAVLDVIDGHINASVTIREVTESSEDQCFAKTVLQNNLLLVETNDGLQHELRGLGSGRWPTAISVVADLIELANSFNRGANLTPTREHVFESDEDIRKFAEPSLS